MGNVALGERAWRDIFKKEEVALSLSLSALLFISYVETLQKKTFWVQSEVGDLYMAYEAENFR